MLTVLIAERAQLDVLQDWPDFADAQAFTDDELPAALDVVTTGRPDIVAIERIFAKKPRGVALINRIKASAFRDSCKIRIVSVAARASNPEGRVSAEPDHAPAVMRAPSTPRSAEGAAAAPRGARVQNNRRRTQRFTIIEGIEVVIDGNPATLVDLSLAGAQVTSSSLLKPNQKVRISFVEDGKPVRFTAGVVWSTFELPETGARYRAGIEFFDFDSEAVRRLCETNRTGRSD